MATFIFQLFEGPAAELRRIVDEPRQGWVDRVLQSRGAASGTFPLSCALEALGEDLERRLDAAALVARKSEARGWAVEMAGDQVRITTAASREATRTALETDGVWHLVQRLAHGIGVDAVLR